MSLQLLVGPPESALCQVSVTQIQTAKGAKSKADLSALTFQAPAQPRPSQPSLRARTCSLCFTRCHQERDPFACPWRLA